MTSSKNKVTTAAATPTKIINSRLVNKTNIKTLLQNQHKHPLVRKINSRQQEL
jgi:hypothetical protein